MKSATKRWQAVVPGEQLEIGLVQVDIAYHSTLGSGYSEQDMKSVRNLVRDSFHAVAELRGGKPHSWGENGGAFMFLIEGDESFDNCCLTAVQMLEMMPSINEDVRLSADINCPIEVRLCCDAGLVAYDPEASHAAGDFIDGLMKHKRQVGATDRVTITDRVFRRLTRQFRSRFLHLRYSKELRADLYSTPASEDGAGLHEPAGPSSRPAAVEASSRQGRLATAASRLRRLSDQAGPWRKAALMLVAVFLGGLALGRAVRPSMPPAAPAAGGPFHPDEWTTWRKHAHERLSSAPVTEGSLVEALRDRPSTGLASPAASLRRDQAIADALLSYPGVCDILWDRFGIDKHFLGTGLSKPVDVPEYCLASVHEYLIPNLPDNHPRVWMRQLKAYNLELEKTVGQLVEEATDHDGERQDLKKVIVARASAKDNGAAHSPVIRFACCLDEKDYSRRLGQHKRARVFASDLAEVWGLKVRDAVQRSGYTFNQKGDTFFVWVFVPADRAEAVPATWGEVLKNLPTWVGDVENKGP